MKYLFIILTLLYCAAGFAQDKTTVAVLELKAKVGAKEKVTSQLTELVGTAIGDMGIYAVMTRNDMLAIVNRIADKQLLAGEDTVSLVRLGRILGVDLLVAGDISLANNIYAVNLKMIDCINGEVVSSLSDQCPGDDVELFNRLGVSLDKLFTVKPLVWTLLNKQGVIKYSYKNKTGRLNIVTDPAGAAVSIDGTAVGATPATMPSIPAGDHLIIVQKDAYYGTARVTVHPGELLKVSIALTKDKGTLKVGSAPAGAAVSVDGVDKGVTPVQIADMAAGDHLVKIIKDGCAPWEKIVVVERNGVQELKAALAEAGSITLAGVPPHAVVILNNRIVENGALAAYPLPAGTVNLFVKAENYETFEQTTELKRGEAKKIDVNLVHKFAALSVNSNPAGAGVFLNDKEVGKTAYTNENLGLGAYKLKVSLDTYDEVLENIVAEKNTSLKYSYELKHTKAFVLAQKRKRQFVQKVIFSSLAAGFTGIGLYMDTKVTAQNTEMDKIYQRYNAAGMNADFSKFKTEYDAADKKTNTYIILRTLFYVLTGGSLAGFGVSFVF